MDAEEIPDCKGCKQPISEGNVIAFGDSVWHPSCFKCSKCQKSLEEESQAEEGSHLLLLGDGRPICEGCCYSCTACGKTINDAAIMTGDDSYHESCFQCTRCQLPIADLTFTKLDNKIVCMNCHNKPLQPASQVDIEELKKRLSSTEMVLEKLKVVSRNALQEFNAIKETLAKEKSIRAQAEDTILLLQAEIESMRSAQNVLIKDNQVLKHNNRMSQIVSSNAIDSDQQKLTLLKQELVALEQRYSCLQMNLTELGNRQIQMVADFQRFIGKVTGQFPESVALEGTNDPDLAKLAVQANAAFGVFQTKTAKCSEHLSQLQNEVVALKLQKTDIEHDIKAINAKKEKMYSQTNLNAFIKEEDEDVSDTIQKQEIRKPLPDRPRGARELPSTKSISLSRDALTQDKPSKLDRVNSSSQGNLMKAQPKSPVSPVTAASNQAALLEAQLNSKSVFDLQRDKYQQVRKVSIMKKEVSKKRPHNFQPQSFIVPSKCTVCAEKVWQVKAKDFQCKDCGQACHAKCIQSTSPDCAGNGKPAAKLAVFGSDLDTLTSAEGRMVPFIVERCIKAINERGLDSEGIYRKSGLQSQVKALIEEWNTASSPDLINLLDDDKYPDINVVAAVIKQYFRSLPAPLITYELYGNFIAAVIDEDEEERFVNLAEAAANLPPPNYETLKFLMIHLSRVASDSSKNLMTAKNLAVVFGPNLMKSPAEKLALQNGEVNAAAELGDMAYKNSIVEYMVNNFESLFQAADVRIEDPMSDLRQFSSGVSRGLSNVDQRTSQSQAIAQMSKSTDGDMNMQETGNNSSSQYLQAQSGYVLVSEEERPSSSFRVKTLSNQDKIDSDPKYDEFAQSFIAKFRKDVNDGQQAL